MEVNNLLVDIHMPYICDDLNAVATAETFKPFKLTKFSPYLISNLGHKSVILTMIAN